MGRKPQYRVLAFNTCHNNAVFNTWISKMQLLKVIHWVNHGQNLEQKYHSLHSRAVATSPHSPRKL